MKWVKHYNLFKESKKEGQYSNKNLISEICVSMLLINNEFLDKILDQGLKARYSEDSHVFLTDLKNLILAKNRLHLGNFVDGKCVIDDEVSKINGLFDSMEFSIEDDWNDLVNARITSRNIIDKVLPGEKLTPNLIKCVYWIGPNKSKEYNEDIVIELESGKQYSFYLNKNLSSQKTASFNLFADDLIGENIDKLYSEEYLPKWNKLTQEWIKIIYENANKNIQQHIEKFIEPNRIDTIGYFEYFDIRHTDVKFKYLGEFIREFNKNILKFSDLMGEIWKNVDSCFSDPERVKKEWNEVKIFVMNSKILEHLLTDSLKTNNADDIKKLDNEYKLAGGTIKMKLLKTIVEKLGCLERSIYFLGNNGNQFYQLPSREFFRKFYDDLNIKFDYHVKFVYDETEEENNDFNIKLILEMNESPLINMNILVKFTGVEMSGKLSSKFKFDIAEDFNYRVSKKMDGELG